MTITGAAGMLPFSLRTLGLKCVCMWSPARVLDLQRRRIVRLVRHARSQSAFYRRLYRSIDPNRFQLADLPTTNKSELMAHFDDAVTNRAIRRADLERFVDNPDNEGQRFLDRYA